MHFVIAVAFFLKPWKYLWVPSKTSRPTGPNRLIMYLSGKQGSVMKIEHRSHGTVHERETNWKNVGIVPYSSHIKFPSQLINTYFHLNTHRTHKMLLMVWSLSLTLECEKVKGLIFHLFFSWQHACFWLVSLVSLLSLCWMYICLVTFNDQDDVNWWVITHAHTHTHTHALHWV